MKTIRDFFGIGCRRSVFFMDAVGYRSEMVFSRCITIVK